MIFILGFFGFSLCLAGRDFLYRFLLVEGGQISQVLFFSGLGCLVCSLLLGGGLARKQGSDLKIKEPSIQGTRILTNALFYFFLLQSFKYLEATSISIISKSYLPLLVLLGPLHHTFYSIRQRVLSILTLISMGIFVYASGEGSDEILGYLFLALSVALVMVEVVLLKRTTIKESPWIIPLIPSLSCVLVGLSLKPPPVESTLLPCYAILAGVFLFCSYLLSIYRYRILPIGLSEYPSLASSAFILLLEWYFLNLNPSFFYLANLTVSMFLVGWILYEHQKKKRV